MRINPALDALFGRADNLIGQVKFQAHLLDLDPLLGARSKPESVLRFREGARADVSSAGAPLAALVDS